MPYIIVQNLVYLLLAFALGALLAWLLGFCRGNYDEITAERDAAKAERDALAERLASLTALQSDKFSNAENEMETAKVTLLQEELKAAKKRIAELELGTK